MRYRIETPLSDALVPQLWAMMAPFENEMLDDTCPHSEEELLESLRKHNGPSYAVVTYLERNCDDATQKQRICNVFATHLERNCYVGRLMGAVWADVIDGKAFGHLVFLPHGLTPAEKMQATKECLRRMAQEQGLKFINWAFYTDNRAFYVFLRRLGARELAIFHKDTVRHGKAVDVRLMVSEAAE